MRTERVVREQKSDEVEIRRLWLRLCPRGVCGSCAHWRTMPLQASAGVQDSILDAYSLNPLSTTQRVALGEASEW